MDVKSVIKQYGYTQVTLAKKMGINRVTLAQMIDGNPTINTLRKIADAIGCKTYVFFNDEREEDGLHITCPKCGAEIKIKLE
jgi:DNA-binding XRE family transcriptional regulator